MNKMRSAREKLGEGVGIAILGDCKERMIKSILSLLFPRECPGCGNSLGDGEGEVCLDCLLDIGETGFWERPRDNGLYQRLGGRMAMEGAAALFYFEKQGRVKRIVSSLKYRNHPQVGVFLGDYMGQLMKGCDWMQEIDVVVPVPLHTARRAERGYNQSAAFGKGLAKALGIRLDVEALMRVKATATQTKKGQGERWENVGDAFQLRRPLTGHVLLVDDVVTTGATTEACGRVILGGGEGVKLSVAALAMAI